MGIILKSDFNSSFYKQAILLQMLDFWKHVYLMLIMEG